MKTYVCNVEHSRCFETPLVAPCMEFPPPQTPPARVVNRDRRLDDQEDIDDAHAPLVAPVWKFAKE